MSRLARIDRRSSAIGRCGGRPLGGHFGRLLPGLLTLALLGAGCSIRKLAIGSLAGALDGLSATFASDDDPELVAEALPFALKTIEALLVEAPNNRDLLLAASSGFTQYAYGFIELEAERLEAEDYLRAEALRGRALGLYLRARDYGLRALARAQPGVDEALRLDPDGAIGPAIQDDVEGLFWTGAAWGSAIALALDQPEVVVDLPAVRVLLEAALAADADWQDGLIHGAMVGLESLPEAMGGSLERARRHFDRAEALSNGQRAGLFVTWARSVAVERQDRSLFIEMLESALAVDVDALPEERLANRIEQRHAARLLSRIDDFFLDDFDQPPRESKP